MPIIFEKKALFTPNKEQIIKVLQVGLEKSFEKVEVNLVECPDLTQPPFHLSTKGICGKPSVADIGGVPYLLPTPLHHKVYNLKEIAGLMEYDKCNLLGAGAAPSHIIGNLAELIVDVSIGSGTDVRNNSHIALINAQSSLYELRNFNGCCEAKHLVNIFASLGDPGKVIEIKVSGRVSKEGLIELLQRIIFEKYAPDCVDTCVGLGGVVVLQSGSAKIHVMPEYATEPLTNIETINGWLRFFEVGAPLVCLGYLVSHDPGLKLRTEHFHCFNTEGAGGHFHHDVTPPHASYLAYFNVPEFLYRFDMP